MVLQMVVIFIIILTAAFHFIPLHKGSFSKTLTHFFMAERSVKSEEFVNSTVGYGYQIAAVALFVYWGFKYGLWTIWVPFFWLAGFYILKYFNNKGLLNSYLTGNNDQTIHGFLAAQNGGHRKLGIIAAVASIVGLSGTAFFEAEFTSRTVAVTIFPSWTNGWIYFFVFFVLVALAYILYGGFKAVIDTDKIQLSLAFIGFNIFAVYLFIQVMLSGNVIGGGVLFFTAMLCILFLDLNFYKFKRNFPQHFPKSYSAPLRITLIFYIVTGIYVIWRILPVVPKLDSYNHFIKLHQVFKVNALGFVSLISLLLANGLWQIVDVSNWQRLAALNKERVSRTQISRLFSFIGWYSAITWVLAILLGMGIRYLIGDVNEAAPLQAILTNYYNRDLIATSVVTVFFVGMICIMSSTLDSLISAISYTIFNDIVYSHERNVFNARVLTFLFTLVFGFLYSIVRQTITGIDAVLYAFYSFQLSLFPSIILTLYGRQYRKELLVLSIMMGILGCIIPLLVNSENFNPYTVGAIFSIGFSSLVLFISTKFDRHDPTFGK